MLEGVHARDYNNGRQAKGPSKLDYETLNKAYSRLSQKEVAKGMCVSRYRIISTLKKALYDHSFRDFKRPTHRNPVN